MAKPKNPGKRYDREQKLGAVQMVQAGRSVKDVADLVGASVWTIRQWVKAFENDQADAFPGSGKLTPQDEELRRLREENRQLKMERDFLKKTMGYFVERPK
jgi:transposase